MRAFGTRSPAQWGGTEEGSSPRQGVWERRLEISLCESKLFIDAGEAEMDLDGSACLDTGSRAATRLFSNHSALKYHKALT